MLGWFTEGRYSFVVLAHYYQVIPSDSCIYQNINVRIFSRRDVCAFIFINRYSLTEAHHDFL